jgi:small-conductance mechanosensitive channel
MATATTAQSADQEIRQAIKDLGEENAKLVPKLIADETKIASLSAELRDAEEAVARGEQKHGRVSQLQDEIDQIQTGVKGAKSIIARNNASVEELQQELGRRTAEARKAAHRKDYEDTRRLLLAKTQSVEDKLIAIATGELAEIEELRTKLSREFEGLGGEQASWDPVRKLLDVDGYFLAVRQPRFAGWIRGPILIPVPSLRPPKR